MIGWKIVRGAEKREIVQTISSKKGNAMKVVDLIDEVLSNKDEEKSER